MVARLAIALAVAGWVPLAMAASLATYMGSRPSNIPWRIAGYLRAEVCRSAIQLSQAISSTLRADRHTDTMAGMERRQSNLTAALTVSCFLIAIYFASYLCCPLEQRAWGYDRHVGYEGLTTLYAPAAWIESQLRRQPVDLGQ